MRTSIIVLVAAMALTVIGCSQPAASAAPSAAGPPTELPGTSWVLKDLSGAELGTGVPTIDFGTDGTVSGSAGCNTFNGTYTVDGSSISFGPLASTKMACPVADMAVETAFLAGLSGATSWSIQALTLTLEGLSTLSFTPA
jgi:heat shock protein HslJ